jgi:transcriptional regulator with XRE-family HTH domain
MSLGQRIRNRRQELKLTQQQLAKALDLTSQHISVIEQDKRTPSLASLAKMAEELGVSVDYLITGRKSIITDTIPSIKADNKLKLQVKKALITLVQALHDKE